MDKYNKMIIPLPEGITQKSLERSVDEFRNGGLKSRLELFGYLVNTAHSKHENINSEPDKGLREALLLAMLMSDVYENEYQSSMFVPTDPEENNPLVRISHILDGKESENEKRLAIMEVIARKYGWVTNPNKVTDSFYSKFFTSAPNDIDATISFDETILTPIEGVTLHESIDIKPEYLLFALKNLLLEIDVNSFDKYKGKAGVFWSLVVYMMLKSNISLKESIPEVSRSDFEEILGELKVSDGSLGHKLNELAYAILFVVSKNDLVDVSEETAPQDYYPDMGIPEGFDTLPEDEGDTPPVPNQSKKS